MSVVPKSEIKEETVEIGDAHYELSDLFTISEMEPSTNEAFRVEERVFRMTVDPVIENAEERDELVARLFQKIISEHSNAASHILVAITHPESGNEIRLPLMPVHSFSGQMVVNEIGNRMQSAGMQVPLTDGQLHLSVTFTSGSPSGSGRVRPTVASALMEGLTSNKNFTVVSGPDKCLPKCIALGELYCEYLATNDRSKLRLFENCQRPNRARQLDDMANRVLGRAGLRKIRDYRLWDVKKIQQAYRQYQILVYDKDARLMFAGEPVRNEHRVLPLLLTSDEVDGHFIHIKRLSVFCGRSTYFCNLCKVKSGSSLDHYNCPYVCQRCGKRAPDGDLASCVGDEKLSCESCNRLFGTRACFEQHSKLGPRGGRSWCASSQVCPDCRQVISTKQNRKHVCGERFCFTCQAPKQSPHECSISSIGPPDPMHQEKRVVFDIETCTYEKMYRGQMTEFHRPIMIVALRSCKECKHVVPKSIEDNLPCTKCGDVRTGVNRLRLFECFNQDLNTNRVTENFVNWMREHKNTTFIAHNMKGFDGQFILRAMERLSAKPENIIKTGRKIMLLNFGSNRMICSLNFLQMKLSAFTKAFDLGELHKGHFPHKLTKAGNFNMPPGPLPDLCYYSPGNLSAKDRAELIAWHTEGRANGVVFNFRKDLRNYCFSDTVLLSQAIHKFSDGFFECTNVRVFEESSTIASAAMKVFRRNFVEDGKIAITRPINDGIKQSERALCYMEWIGKKENVVVKHKYRGGEQQVPGTRYHLDGFIEGQNGQRGRGIEYHGMFFFVYYAIELIGKQTFFNLLFSCCYFHLHDCRYTEWSTMHGDSYALIKSRDRLKAEAVKKHYDLEVVWDCEVTAMLARDPEMREFFKEQVFQAPLDARDALYGGRTEVHMLKLEKRDEEEKLAYFDYTSLYPWCNKYGRYPIGSPRQIYPTEVKVPITKPEELLVDGFMRCKVTAPGNLERPLLPYRERSTLLFGLCRVCMETANQESCRHSLHERRFIGTWATAELTEALKLGYVINETQHWDIWWQYDETKPITDPSRHGPFSRYIDAFLKLKTEASGFPDWAHSDEERLQYIEEFLQTEGIQLEYAKILKNSHTRQISKLLLNSLWGKLGERPDKKKTVYITNPVEFWKMIDNPEFEISDIEICTPVMLRVEYRDGASSNEDVPAYQSVSYASLTTVYARLRLYEAMKMIPAGDMAYCDTDSLVYRYRGNNPLQPLIGDALGMLTDEVKTGSEIVSFVAQGPKCYAYLTRQADGAEATVVKCRGFKQTYDAAQIVNYSTIEKHVEQLRNMDEVEVLSVRYFMIQNTGTSQLFNVNQRKHFGASFGKRRICNDYSTLPFGFV